MKKITLLFLCLILPLAISCTNPMKDFKESNIKAKFRSTANPQLIKNAKPDAHAAEETAIHVASDDGEMIYVGQEPFPLDVVNSKIAKLLEKTPAERNLVYVHGNGDMDYVEMLRILETLRKGGIENIGLMMTPATKNDTYFNILKIKMTPEPKFDDEEVSRVDELVVCLTKGAPTSSFPSGKTKISFGAYDKKYNFKLEKEEIDWDGLQAKIAERLKEREAKKVLIPGTSEVDKRVFIRGTHASSYGAVAHLIDAATGAGASVVYLQIDDLPLE